jgi:ribosomal protein L20A (L18A)
MSDESTYIESKKKQALDYLFSLMGKVKKTKRETVKGRWTVLVEAESRSKVRRRVETVYRFILLFLLYFMRISTHPHYYLI